MNKFIKPLTLIMAIAVPVIASADIEVHQLAENEVSVTYDANDATTNYGREELEREIRRAAEKVCGPQSLRKAISVGQLGKNRSCYKESVAQAMKSIKTNGLIASK